MNYKKFILKQKDIKCEVYSGSGIEKELINYIKNFKSNKFVVISDSKIARIHAKKFTKKLNKKGINADLFIFKEGEKNKNRKTKEMIEDQMFAKKYGRDSCIIAFGGGVTGDLAGFIAATYMRGIPVMQIPTTTISVVDSSYGGKTGIDVPAGKNLIGAYHQPAAVFIDMNYLKTLDNRNYISGLIETLKHGFIYDKKLYFDFKNNIDLIKSRKGKRYEIFMSDLLLRSILVKQKIVKKDEKESNLRKVLNYGHTIGHAVEKLSKYKLQHGEAIAIGIAAESYLAYKNNLISKKDFLEQKNTIESLGLSTKIPKNQKTRDIINLTKIDKKARNGKAEFTLISKIGKYAIKKNGDVAFAFDEKDVKNIIEEYKKLK